MKGIYDYPLHVFDFDGTLVHPKDITQKFPHGPFDRDWYPGRVTHLIDLRRRGIHTAIASNQGGAAWGFFAPQQMNEALRVFADQARIERVEVCYYHPSGHVPSLIHPGHPDRKPNPGMLLRILEDFHLREMPEAMLFVGDEETDEEAADRAGCAFMYAAEYFDEMY